MNTLYHDLTDSQWEKVKQKLPKEKLRRRPQIDSRNAFNGIMWILANGVTWRFLPEKYGKWIRNSANGLMTAFSIILLKIAIDSFTFCRKYQGLFFTVLSSKVKRYWQIKPILLLQFGNILKIAER